MKENLTNENRAKYCVIVPEFATPDAQHGGGKRRDLMVGRDMTVSAVDLDRLRGFLRRFVLRFKLVGKSCW